MKSIVFGAALTIVLFVTCQQKSKDASGNANKVEANQYVKILAQTPPMGWNSWNCFGFELTEDLVRETADYMAENLLDHGWEYLVIDMGWYYPLEMTTNDGHRKNPLHTIDEWGRLMPDIVKFPSSANDKGFKPLADYVHSKGLKFGIHIMRGIPWDAVENKLPIMNNSNNASEVALLQDTCEWNKSMKGVDVSQAAGQAYYNSIFELYAQWGVDYVKVDDMSRPYNANNIEAVNRAIAHSGREMVLSLSPGPTPLDQADHVKRYAHLWRISNDFWDHWKYVLRQMNYCKEWYPHIGAGHWPDIDMLPFGKLRVTGADEWVASLLEDDFENIADEYTRFTKDEQLTVMNLMAIFRSPLMMGGHLIENDEWTLSLLTNKNVIYVNQHSTANREVAFGEDWSVWAAKDKASDDVFVALFNLADHKQEVNIDLEKLGLSQSVEVKDVWSQISLGDFNEKIHMNLEPHASALLRVKSTNNF